MLAGIVFWCGISFYVMPIISQEVHDTYEIVYEKNCGVSPNGSALLTIRTDMPDPEIYAICANETEFNFEIKSEVRYELVVYYHDTPGKCIFKKMTLAEMYHVTVFVPPVPNVFLYDIVWKQMQCTFGATRTTLTHQTYISRSGAAPETITDRAELQSNTSISLYVVDVDGNKITGRTPVGRYISLRAEMIEPFYPNEVSFQVIRCIVVGEGSDKFYALIVRGCGDGGVIPSNEGFITTGKSASSVLFRSFGLPGTSEFRFDCQIAICQENCDGPSCTKQRGKRSAVSHHAHVGLTFDELVYEEPTLRNVNRRRNRSGIISVHSGKTKFQMKTPDESTKSTDSLRIQIIVIFFGTLAFVLIMAVFAYVYYIHINREMVRYRKLAASPGAVIAEEMVDGPTSDCQQLLST